MIQVHHNYICDFCAKLWYTEDYELHQDNQPRLVSTAGNRIGTQHACMECMAKARDAIRARSET